MAPRRRTGTPDSGGARPVRSTRPGRYVLVSVVLHVLVFGLFFANISFLPQTTEEHAGDGEIIEAFAVEEEVAMAPIREREAAEEEARRQAEEEARRQREEEERERQEAERREQERLEEQRRQEEEEQARQEAEEEARREEERRQQEEAERLEREEEERRQQEEEERRQEEERRRQEEEERQREEEERRRQEEEERRQQEEEQRRQEEEERRRQEEEERQRQEEEAQREAEERARQEAIEAERRAREVQQMVGSYAGRISAELRRAWVRPSGTPAGLEALVRIRLSRHGDVQNVEITRGSGNDAFDASVVRAAYRAAPLPMPDEEDANRELRERTYRFAPDR